MACAEPPHMLPKYRFWQTNAARESTIRRWGSTLGGSQPIDYRHRVKRGVQPDQLFHHGFPQGDRTDARRLSAQLLLIALEGGSLSGLPRRESPTPCDMIGDRSGDHARDQEE
jgi:hypothetical protein